MIDITPFQQKLYWLKEWMDLRIDRNMRSQVVLEERKPVGNGDIYFDIRNFDAYCRHKKREYKNQWLRHIYNQKQ